jgi:hypothetical protein
MEIIKSKIVIILLAALAIIIGCLYFWYQAKPKEQPAPTSTLPNLPQPEIKEKTVSTSPSITGLEGKFGKFSKSLPVYRIIVPTISYDQALTIAQTFGFSEKPKVIQSKETGEFYSWTEGAENLTISPAVGSISYEVNLLGQKEKARLEIPTLEESKTLAIAFFKSKEIPFPENMEPTTTGSQYLKISGPVYEPATKETADLVQVDFGFKINNIDIFQATVEEPSLRIILNLEGKATRLEYRMLAKSLTPENTYPLKTEQDVLNEVLTSRQITYLQFPNWPNWSPVLEGDYRNVQSMDFSDVRLVYLQPAPGESYLQPVFLLHGTFKLVDGRSGDAYLYLPAVNKNFLIPGP